MHEILQCLPAGGRVLDLGCRDRSFPADICPSAFITRLDLDRPKAPDGDMAVQADAAYLPFRADCFDVIVANHSLEHMGRLKEVFSELGRVLKKSGAIYIAVPDSSTLTDRLYRWVYHGGGHINAFRHPDDIIAPLRQTLGEASVGVRVLHTSFSFLARRHFHPRPPRRLWIFLNGRYSVIATFSYLCRLVDRTIGSRLSVYGWAVYYGTLRRTIDTAAWSNVCVHCGAAHPADLLRPRLFVRRALPFIKLYTCPACEAWNFFTNDA
jgi:SAM-dependent methyltransferase